MRRQGQPVRLHAVARGHDRRGIRRGVSLLPSLFTLANLFCGWACVVHAMRGEFRNSVTIAALTPALSGLPTVRRVNWDMTMKNTMDTKPIQAAFNPSFLP